MTDVQKFTTDQVAQALTDTKGMVYLAARKLGCSHTTVYNYLKRYAKVREAKEAAEGVVIDTAELKLYDAILNGEDWAIKYTLSTKGKSRGYVERSELTGKDGGAIEHTHTWKEFIASEDEA